MTPRRTAGLCAVLMLASAAGVALGSWRPLHLVAVAWTLTLVWALPRTSTPWAWALAALGLRLLAGTPRVHMHFAKGYALLDAAAIPPEAHARYGDGWPALLGTWTLPWSQAPDVVHATHLAWSVLTVALLVAAAHQAWGGRAAHGVGALAAALPVPVALASTDTRFVAVTMLQAAAAWGLLRADRRGDLLAALSIGLLAHTRPLHAVTAVLLVLLAHRWRGSAVSAVAGVLVGWRVLELGVWAATGGTTAGAHLPMLLTSRPWWPLAGEGAPALLLDPTLTPIALPVLAAAGAGLAWRRRDRLGLLAVVLLVASLLLALPQPLPADRLRFQLPTFGWAAVLATVALVEAWRRRPAMGAALAVALLASWLPAARPVSPPFAWQHEYDVLRRALPHLPEGARVAYDDREDPAGDLSRWVQRRTATRWGAAPEAGWRWRGTADARHGTTAPDPERWEPVHVVTRTVRWGGFGPTGSETEPVTVGLYRRR